MKTITDFFAAIDTAGGHMMLMTALIVLGIAAHTRNPADPLIHDFVVGAIGVLFGSLRGENGAKKRLEPKLDIGTTVSTTATQTTETTTPTPPVAPDAP